MRTWRTLRPYKERDQSETPKTQQRPTNDCPYAITPCCIHYLTTAKEYPALLGSAAYRWPSSSLHHHGGRSVGWSSHWHVGRGVGPWAMACPPALFLPLYPTARAARRGVSRARQSSAVPSRFLPVAAGLVRCPCRSHRCTRSPHGTRAGARRAGDDATTPLGSLSRAVKIARRSALRGDRPQRGGTRIGVGQAVEQRVGLRRSVYWTHFSDSLIRAGDQDKPGATLRVLRANM